MDVKESSMLKRFLTFFNIVERQDFSVLYTDSPVSCADKFPDIPKPEPKLTPKLLAAQWIFGDLRGEDMPPLAADLLEAGFDSPSLRRLAGEIFTNCTADVQDLVDKMFRELAVPYPMSEPEAKLLLTRQIAREVISGKRNPWAATTHLERVVWNKKCDDADVQHLFDLHDEINWNTANRGMIPALTVELIETFARLGALTEREKRMISFGCLEGKGWIADDFDAPLPDELLALFEGRDEPPAG
jgi:hypothetical protein